MASIQLSEVHKHYGASHALKGIDLAIGDGEFVVFVGPSGCGKSTLLRVMAGLEAVSSGHIRIGGAEVTQQPPSRRGIAMVFQNYALYPHMSARENLSFGMRMRGVPRDEIARKVQRAARLLELEPCLDRRPGELSGGQCQRVAIGRAIVQEPGAFLFDEPLSNLDAELRLRLRTEIAALHRALAATMVYVTHDQLEAMALAQRIVVLRAGEVEQVGSPMELYQRPANTFVASFIGTPAMNFVPATLRDGRVELADGAVAALAEPACPPDLPQPCAVTLGIRPEHLQPHPEGALRVQVDYVEELGARVYVGGRCGASGAPLRVEVPAGIRVTAGEGLRLGLAQGRAHVFDAEGRRVAGCR